VSLSGRCIRGCRVALRLVLRRRDGHGHAHEGLHALSPPDNAPRQRDGGLRVQRRDARGQPDNHGIGGHRVVDALKKLHTAEGLRLPDTVRNTAKRFGSRVLEGDGPGE